MNDRTITRAEAKDLVNFVEKRPYDDEAERRISWAIDWLTMSAEQDHKRAIEAMEYLARHLLEEAEALKKNPTRGINSLGVVQGRGNEVDVRVAKYCQTLESLEHLRGVMHAIKNTADPTPKPRASRPNKNEAKRTCAFCTLKIGDSDILYYEGRPAHFLCADERRIHQQPCTICGKRIGIASEYEELAENQYTHSACLNKLVREEICLRCGEPIGYYKYEKGEFEGQLAYFHEMCPKDMKPDG